MELIQGYWYDFARTGDPNGGSRPEWKQYEGEFDVCDLGNTTHMLTPEEQEKYAYFWKKLSNSEVVSPIKLGALATI
jgi:para-nitrobenzyl esterase